MNEKSSRRRLAGGLEAESVATRARILILTDDADASSAWSDVLYQHDIEAEVMSYDSFPYIMLAAHSFHAIIVDHHDGSDDALQICGRMRGLSPQPLLLFTHETNERFYMDAYRLGVEECAKRPIGIPLFVAKTQARLRQVYQYQQAEETETVMADGFHLDPETSIFGTSETSVRLSNLECRLLSILMANRGQVMESGLLAQRVWSIYSNPDPRRLKNLVYRLRHKIGRVSGGDQYIKSVAGTGYVFQADQ